MPPLRLLTIPVSHYCEKARWALERIGLAYHEERHIQGFHYARTFWVSRNPGVPVLIDGKQVVVDSTEILKHLDRYAAPETRLYPQDPAARRQVEALEDLFDETLGVESRRWFYFHYLPEGRAALRVAGQGVPRIERTMAPLAYPLMRRYAAWLLQVNASTVGAGLARSREIVAQTDALLADGRPIPRRQPVQCCGPRARLHDGALSGPGRVRNTTASPGRYARRDAPHGAGVPRDRDRPIHSEAISNPALTGARHDRAPRRGHVDVVGVGGVARRNILTPCRQSVPAGVPPAPAVQR